MTWDAVTASTSRIIEVFFCFPDGITSTVIVQVTGIPPGMAYGMPTWDGCLMNLLQTQGERGFAAYPPAGLCRYIEMRKKNLAAKQSLR
jgi:hypothetical protein